MEDKETITAPSDVIPISGENARGHRTLARVLLWICVASLAAIGLGLIAGRTGPPLRRLVVFSVIEGLAAGWIAGRCGRWLMISHRRGAVIAGGTAGILAVITTSIVTWRDHAATVDREYRSAPGVAMLQNMSRQAPRPDAGDPEAVEAWEQFQAGIQSIQTEWQHRMSWKGWLAFRVSPVTHNSTLAIAVWWLELALAATGGAWLAAREASHAT